MEKKDFQRLREILKKKDLSILEVLDMVEALPDKGKKAISLREEMRFVVDYTKTLRRAIAEGDYGRVNSDITSKSFPVPPEMVGKKVEVAARLFSFRKKTPPMR